MVKHRRPVHGGIDSSYIYVFALALLFLGPNFFTNIIDDLPIPPLPTPPPDDGGGGGGDDPIPPDPTPEPEPEPIPEQENVLLNGFSGSFTSTSGIDKIISALDKYKLNTFRETCNPTWILGGTRPFNPSLIDYYLANCNHTLVICRNHLYPPSSMTDTQWAQAEADIFNSVLSRWGNNSRVLIEIVNECNQSPDAGYHTKIQNIISHIRSAGYTNGIVQNNQLQQPDSQAWVKYIDPLDNVYQGQHTYLNQFSTNPLGSLGKAQWLFTGPNQATSKGITNFLNTEVGANTSEGAYTTKNIEDLNAWLYWSKNNKIGFCIWLNHNTDNLSTYEAMGLVIPN